MLLKGLSRPYNRPGVLIIMYVGATYLCKIP